MSKIPTSPFQRQVLTTAVYHVKFTKCYLYRFLDAFGIEKLIFPICVNQGIHIQYIMFGNDIGFYNTTNNSDLVILIVHCGICDHGLYSKVNMWSTGICITCLRY